MSKANVRAIIFAAGGEKYGIKLLELVSIEKAEGLARVPNTPNEIIGIVSIRGTLLPVIDIAYFMKGSACMFDEQTRLLVCRQEYGNLAIAVDEAADIVELNLEALDKGAGLATDSFKAGIVSTDQGLITLIEAKPLAEAIKQRVHS